MILVKGLYNTTYWQTVYMIGYTFENKKKIFPFLCFRAFFEFILNPLN